MIIFVGDKPSKKMKPGARPFEGAACEKRLNEWLDILMGDLDGEKCYVANASGNIAPIEKWNCWEDKVYRKVVALGNKASTILTKAGIPHFKLPHPSGRNRQINDKEFINKKLEECRLWLKSGR